MALPIDLNSKILIFLQNNFLTTNTDVTALTIRYLATLTGDYNNRMNALIASAVAFVG